MMWSSTCCVRRTGRTSEEHARPPTRFWVSRRAASCGPGLDRASRRTTPLGMRTWSLSAVPQRASGVRAPRLAAVRAVGRRDHRPRLHRGPRGSHKPVSARADVQRFTYFERLLMIRDALLAEGLKPQGFAIVPFPVHEPGLVCHYVPEGAVHFVRVYSRWEEEKVRRLRGVGAPVEILDPG